tara:strand:+ start:982 stop:1839 length:858 start_codon:yes stop_codon:yes gene_type:complete
MSLEFQRSSYYDRVNKIIDGLVLKNSPSDNEIIKNRFLYEVMHYEYKRDSINKYYNGLRFVMTIGSILLPAILSIGQMDPTKLPRNFDTITYWTSWSLSLTITACNGFLQLFSLDKNYIAYSLVVEQLKTEGWQYFQLSGKYENAQSHGQAFKQFCKSVEGVKRKQIEQEYNGKGEDKKNKFNFEDELNKTLPKQFQSPANDSSSTSVSQSALGTALEVGDAVSDLKKTLQSANDRVEGNLQGGKQGGKQIAKGLTTEIIDKSIEGMEEGKSKGNNPSGNKPGSE